MGQCEIIRLVVTLTSFSWSICDLECWQLRDICFLGKQSSNFDWFYSRYVLVQKKSMF